jgi:hypothetical protein
MLSKGADIIGGPQAECISRLFTKAAAAAAGRQSNKQQLAGTFNKQQRLTSGSSKQVWAVPLASSCFQQALWRVEGRQQQQLSICGMFKKKS